MSLTKTQQVQDSQIPELPEIKAFSSNNPFRNNSKTNTVYSLFDDDNEEKQVDIANQRLFLDPPGRSMSVGSDKPYSVLNQEARPSSAYSSLSASLPISTNREFSQ